jgi:hypothetical protein
MTTLAYQMEQLLVHLMFRFSTLKVRCYLLLIFYLTLAEEF